MITKYKQLLERSYKQLKQPDITKIPWKFALFPANFFEVQNNNIPVNYAKEHEIIVCDITHFFKNFPEIAQKYFYALLQKFQFKNTWNMHAHIFAQQQWVMYIQPDVQVNDVFVVPLQNVYIENITIIVGKNAQVVLHEKMFIDQYKRIKNVDIIVEENAHINFIAEYNDSRESNAFLYYRFFLYCNAQLAGNFAMCGGNITFALLDIFLCALGAQADIKGYYRLDNSRQSIIVTNQYHLYKQTVSNVIMKGILTDKAQAAYYGTIEIAKNASQAQAYQENKNIVLSDQAKVFSQPNLEIQTNDVRCKHGSAIGKFDPDQLMYMQARGLSLELAQKLLLEAFIADVIPFNYNSKMFKNYPLTRN